MRIKIFNNLEKREVEVLKLLDYKNVMKYYDYWIVVFFIFIIYFLNKEEFNEKYFYLYLVMLIEFC